MRKLNILVTMLFFASLGFAQKGTTDNIKMQNLDKVVISASRTNAKLKDLTAKVEVITKKAISQSSAKDLADLLKTNTSIDIVQYPGSLFLSGIGMRGFAPGTNTKYVTILIDGVPAGTMNMSSLMLNGVQQVEILKGPFSSLYGSNAMGGLINIVPTYNKGKLTGNVSLAYGSWKTLNTNVSVGGKIVGGLSFDFNTFYNKVGENYKIGKNNFYNLNATQEAILDKNSYGAEMNHTTYNNKGGSLRLGYDFNENWKINLFGTFFKNGGNITNTNFWGTYGKYGLTEKNIDFYNTRISVEGKINNHLLKFNGYNDYSYYNGKSDKTGFKKYDGTTKTHGFQLQDVISLGKHKVIVGVDNKNDISEVGSFNDKDGKEKAPSKPNYKNNSFGAFAQANLKFFNDRLDIAAGVRYDIVKLTLEANEFLKNAEKSENYNNFSPNLGLKFKLTKNSALHANYGKAFMAPDAYQKAGEYTGAYGTTKGNPDLKGEYSETFDLGLSYNNFEQGVNIDVTYFNTKHNDKIVSKYMPNNGNPYTTFENAEKARMSGLELAFSYDFGSLFDYDFSLKAYANTTLLFKDDFKKQGSETWNETLYVRKKIGNFGLHFMSKEKWNIKLNGRFIGSRIERDWFAPSKWAKSPRPTLAKLAMQTQPQYYGANPKLLKHPNFMVFDASVYYNITKNITVGVNANNILNENYTEKDGYNMPGRNFMGKVSYKF